MGDIVASIRLSEELHRKAREKCERENVTLSQILRRWVQEWVQDDPPEREEQPEAK